MLKFLLAFQPIRADRSSRPGEARLNENLMILEKNLKYGTSTRTNQPMIGPYQQTGEAMTSPANSGPRTLDAQCRQASAHHRSRYREMELSWNKERITQMHANHREGTQIAASRSGLVQEAFNTETTEKARRRHGDLQRPAVIPPFPISDRSHGASTQRTSVISVPSPWSPC